MPYDQSTTQQFVAETEIKQCCEGTTHIVSNDHHYIDTHTYTYQLQSVLNAAARLTHRSSRYEHVTPILRDLHWLWSPERIDFKLAVLTYRCLHSLESWYLSDYIQSVTVSNHHRLRSLSSSQLVIRCTRLSTVGDRAFPVAGCRPTSPQLQRCLFFETSSKLISFPDHFLPNCFWFLVLHTVYSSGLAVFVLWATLNNSNVM